MEGIQLKMIDREALVYLVQELENFEKDKALHSGLLAAARVFKSGGQIRLKRRMKRPNGVTGNLLKAFSVRVKKSKPGALAGFAHEGAHHSWMVDMGTENRYQKKKKNKFIGAGPALKFWTDTRELDPPKALDKLNKGVEKAVKRIQERRR